MNRYASVHKNTVQSDKVVNTKKTLRFYGLSDFDMGTVVGSGKFGKVFLAKEKKSNLLVAIKIIGKEHIAKHELEKQLFYEIYYHSKMKHPNITKLYTYFHDERSLYLVLEYSCNGTLYKNMRLQKYKRFTEDLAAKYIYQTIDALRYVHNFDFFHGDVKPENILLDLHGNVKLADFGLAWPSDWTANTGRKGLCGTRDYMTPEQLNNEPYNEKIDHWSLGVMCFELLVGRSPFSSKWKEVTIQRILNVDIKYPKIVKREAKNLISRLVTYEPDDRLPLESAMSHKWIELNYNRARTK